MKTLILLLICTLALSATNLGLNSTTVISTNETTTPSVLPVDNTTAPVPTSDETEDSDDTNTLTSDVSSDASDSDETNSDSDEQEASETPEGHHGHHFSRRHRRHPHHHRRHHHGRRPHPHHGRRPHPRGPEGPDSIEAPTFEDSNEFENGDFHGGKDHHRWRPHPHHHRRHPHHHRRPHPRGPEGSEDTERPAFDDARDFGNVVNTRFLEVPRDGFEDEGHGFRPDHHRRPQDRRPHPRDTEESEDTERFTSEDPIDAGNVATQESGDVEHHWRPHPHHHWRPHPHHHRRPHHHSRPHPHGGPHPRDATAPESQVNAEEFFEIPTGEFEGEHRRFRHHHDGHRRPHHRDHRREHGNRESTETAAF